MEQGTSFLASVSGNASLQSVITTLQQLAIGLGNISTNLTAALVNVANQNG